MGPRIRGVVGQEAQEEPRQLDGGEGRGHDSVAGDPGVGLRRREAVGLFQERRQHRLQ